MDGWIDSINSISADQSTHQWMDGSIRSIRSALINQHHSYGWMDQSIRSALINQRINGWMDGSIRSID
jgi:hypothetical protein